MKRFSFITTGAPGGYEAGDPVFDSHDTLSYDIKNPPAELCEGAETDGDPLIEPGESIEWVYFWTTKDNYYGPITVQFDKNATGGTDPRTMRFDTTGKESDGYKAAVEAAEAIKAQGGVDYAAYSVKAADGWSLVETKEKSSDATFNPEGSTKRFSTSTCSRAPQKEAEALQGNFGGKGESRRGGHQRRHLDALHPNRHVLYVHRGPVRHHGPHAHRQRHHLGRCHAHDAERDLEISLSARTSGGIPSKRPGRIAFPAVLRSGAFPDIWGRSVNCPGSALAAYCVPWLRLPDT